MKVILTLAVLILSLSLTKCRVGAFLYYSINYDVQTVQCIMKNGFTDISTIVQANAKQIEKDDLQQIQVHIDADAPPFDIMLFPCRNRNSSELVDEFIKKIKPYSYKNVWLAPYFTVEKQCNWRYQDFDENCNILNNLLLEFKKRFIYPGIASQMSAWAMNMGSCSKFSKENLYWWPQFLDGQPSFNSFTPFAGWNAPYKKLYKTSQQTCGVPFGLTFQP